MVQSVEVLGPGGGETGDVVNVRFDVVEIAEGSFDQFLSDIGGLGDPHGKTAVAVESEGGGDGGERFRRFRELVSVKTL